MRYFAYGSNLDERQMRERCPGARLIGAALLSGYRLDFTIFSPIRGGGCADIVRSPGSEVWGVLYELTNDDLMRLDGFEGVSGGKYRRIPVVVERPPGITESAHTYEVAHKSGFITPTPAYLEIIREAAVRYGFPKAYRMQLETIARRS